MMIARLATKTNSGIKIPGICKTRLTYVARYTLLLCNTVCNKISLFKHIASYCIMGNFQIAIPMEISKIICDFFEMIAIQ